MTKRHGFAYRQVADELRRRIQSGEYKRGETIPSEGALVAEFGVSSITIRRAVRDLMFEGLLHGRWGRGVFVSDTRKIVRVLAADARVSLGDEIRRAGLVPGIVELDWSRHPASRDIARQLGIRPGTSLFRHEKLILADEQPVILDTIYLRRALAERLRDRLREEVLFKVLGDSGIAVGHAQFRFEGTAATPEQAEHLNLRPHFPIVVTRYILFDPDDKPILLGTTASRSDRVVFDVYTQPEDKIRARELALEHGASPFQNAQITRLNRGH